MTALVIEDVSTTDLDALDEATCWKDGRPAVGITSHEGCSVHVCSEHYANAQATRAWQAQSPTNRRAECAPCGRRRLRLEQWTVRPI